MEELICPFCSADEETQFKIVSGADNPQGETGPYAYMLYQCECDAVCKQNIWSHSNELWINATNDAIIMKKI
jgi:sarcosine oxidase delta subunit